MTSEHLVPDSDEGDVLLRGCEKDNNLLISTLPHV